jgi:hypothetical protein
MLSIRSKMADFTRFGRQMNERVTNANAGKIKYTAAYTTPNPPTVPGSNAMTSYSTTKLLFMKSFFKFRQRGKKR